MLFLYNSTAAFCTTWTVVNSGFAFSPATLTITDGDIVQFTLASNHNAREVSQTTWNANGNTALSGGFQTAFSGGTVTAAQLTVGTHYYVCSPHAGGGMKATIIVQAAPLPVSLTAFTATQQNKQVALNWCTATEQNNNYFEVQRTIDGAIFTTIGTVRGAGTTNVAQKYNLVDTKPLEGINYYRLNQVDFDGKQAFSPTVSVEMDYKVNVNIMPNPAYDNVTIAIGGENSTTSVRIADATGRVLLLINNISDKQNIDISQLPQGIYFIQISVDKENYIHRLVKI